MTYNLYQKNDGKWYSPKPFSQCMYDNRMGRGGMEPHFEYWQTFYNQSQDNIVIYSLKIIATDNNSFFIDVYISDLINSNVFENKAAYLRFKNEQTMSCYRLAINSYAHLTKFLDFIDEFESLGKRFHKELINNYIWFNATNHWQRPPQPRIPEETLPRFDEPKHLYTAELHNALNEVDDESVEKYLYLGAQVNTPINVGEHGRQEPLIHFIHHKF